MNDILKCNMANINSDINLFGEKTDKLSMRERIGFLPISIWQPDWTITKKLKEIVGDEADERKEAGTLGYMGSRGIKTSIFNPHLAQMILSAYCPANANIYDPFAGGGTRGFIAVAMGHKYSGSEIRAEEVNRVNEQMKILNKPFTLKCEDSREYSFGEEEFDFSYTCPPYYNLEIYSKMPGDISNADTYEQFIAMLMDCMTGVYKGLKHNSLSVWVVGNFRDKQGYLMPFNSDLIRIADSIGFKLHDELIWWGASKCASQRCGQFEANRKSVRVHEYIIILKKT